MSAWCPPRSRARGSPSRHVCNGRRLFCCAGAQRIPASREFAMLRYGFRCRLVACLFVLGLSAGCGSQSTDTISGGSASGKRIVILMNGNSPFWDAVGTGIKAAEQELKLADAGLSATLEVNNGTPQGQIDKLKQFA